MHQKLILLGVLALLLVIIHIHGRSILGFRGSERFTDGGSGQLTIVKASWCGHCKSAMPEFEKLVAASPLKLSDGSSVTLRMLDGDEDKAEVSKLNVKGFPTILYLPAGSATATEYSGPRTYDGVISFLQNQ